MTPVAPCGLALCILVSCEAADLPLTFQTVAPANAGFPGGFGSSGPVSRAIPPALKKRPAITSDRPFYGTIRESSSTSFTCVLDESKGSGTGYDRIILDLNRNGDLTDDPATSRADVSCAKKTSTMEELFFGPFEDPAKPLVGGHRPVYYAKVTFYCQRPADSSVSPKRFVPEAGYLRIKTAWYFETEAQVDGRKYKIGLYDGDGNARLGEAWAPSYYRSGAGQPQEWYFSQRDCFLVDHDNSGTFESEKFDNEAIPYSTLLCLGKSVFKPSMSTGCKSLRLEPWPTALAEVRVEPRGQEVCSVLLAMEQPAGKWQLFSAPVESSKLRVPAGKYRLYACLLQARAAGEQVMVEGGQRIVRTPFFFSAEKENTLRCGGPLELKVKAEKRKGIHSGFVPEGDLAAGVDYLSISEATTGQDGETYFSFGKGPGFQSHPAEPTFTISDEKGSTLHTGKLEFG